MADDRHSYHPNYSNNSYLRLSDRANPMSVTTAKAAYDAAYDAASAAWSVYNAAKIAAGDVVESESTETMIALKGLSTIWNELIDLALDGEYKEYYGFNVLIVPEQLIDSDKQLASLRKRYPFTAGITKMEPNTVYNWHKDTNRSGTINMMIWNVDSHCLFTQDAGARVSQVEELIYEPATYYIFNTQVSHMVVNLDGNRYMFTLEFSDTVTYENLLDFFEVKNDRNAIVVNDDSMV